MKNDPFTVLIAAILPMLVVGLGCSRIAGLKTNYLEGDSAAKVVAGVKSKVGPSFRVVEAVVEVDEMRLQIVDPNNPQNVDQYSSRAGFLTGPEPVKLNALVSDPAKSSVPVEEIDFEAVPKIVSSALEQTALDGGVVKRLTFQRGFALQGSDAGSLGAPRWHVEVTGTRENATATANGKGEIIGLDLSRTSRGKNYTVLSNEELTRAQKTLKSIVGGGARVSGVTIRKDSVAISTVAADGSNDEEDFTFGLGGVKKGLVTSKAVRTPTKGYFSLDDIDFTKALDYLEKAKVRLNMPNSEISSISYTRTVKSVLNLDDKHNRIDISLREGKNEGSVGFDLSDGSEVSARRNGRELK